MEKNLLPHDIEMALLVLLPLDAQLAATLKDKQSLVISALMASLNILWIKDYYFSTPFKQTTNLSEKDPWAWLFHDSDIRDDGGQAADVQQIVREKGYRRISKWECDLHPRQAQMCVACTNGWRDMLRQILSQFYRRQHSCLVVVEKMYGKHFALKKSGSQVKALVFEPGEKPTIPVSVGTMPSGLDCLPVLKVAREFRWAIEEDLKCRRRSTRGKKMGKKIQYPALLDVSVVVSSAAVCIHVAV
jgi:hypothetical protein